MYYSYMNNYQLYDVLFGNKNITIIVEKTITNDQIFNIVCNKLNLNPTDYQLTNGTPTKLILEHKKFFGGGNYKQYIPITTETTETISESDENNTEDKTKNVINMFDRDHTFRIDYSKYSYD